MHFVFSPAVRLAFAVGCALGAALLVGADWSLRSTGIPSPFGPTAPRLWVSVGLGAVVGGLAGLWESYLLRRQRAFLLDFYLTPVRDRYCWRLQRKNLLLCGW